MKFSFFRNSIFVLLLAAGCCSAATLDDYHQRLQTAAMDIGVLQDRIPKTDLATRDIADENDTIAAIKAKIPASEKIDLPAGSVETQNQWLHDALDSFAKESKQASRRDILTGAIERLAGIARDTDELIKATAAARSKDEDKQKLGEILNRQEYQKPEPQEESLFQRWWRKFTEWLDSVFPKPKTVPSVAPGEFSGLKVFLQILVWGAVFALLGFLIYKFGPSLASRFGFTPKAKKKDRVILGERIAADESASDLFSEAERLAREGNLRGAIRKGYIALLCELSDRKVIGLARHKTNRDYLRDVRKRTDLVEGMSGMTSNYERNWYGLRPAGAEDWEDFRNKYKQTVARVSG